MYRDGSDSVHNIRHEKTIMAGPGRRIRPIPLGSEIDIGKNIHYYTSHVATTPDMTGVNLYPGIDIRTIIDNFVKI
jgi:hypothetical protein